MLKHIGNVCLIASLSVFLTPLISQAAVQYQNDFESPSSENVGEAYPEWIDAGGNSVRAVNSRLEWGNSGDNDDWILLDLSLPNEYNFEFDFFTQEGINGRFSVWPAVQPGESIFERHNYFIRKNTHYFNGSDTIPSEGPRDMSLPLVANPHRLRFEVTGDHVVFLYKDRGQGGWILVDERDFPAFGEGERFIQLGYNHDGGAGGVHWIDNMVVNFSDQQTFRYFNTFDSPSDIDPSVAWPELVAMDPNSGSANAVNGRIEFDRGRGNDDWLRLDFELPEAYIVEFDLFYDSTVIPGRFSFWPLVADDATTVFDYHHYFLRDNTHYFSFSDTIPSEGPRDLLLPAGSDPHRIRAEVNGDHIALLYKDQGVGGWILIDERDFPPLGDVARYTQFGMHYASTPGDVWIDNLEVTGLPDNRAVVERSIGAEVFEADTPLPVSIKMIVSGSLPSLTIVESFPEGWTATNVSHGGVVNGNTIIWSFTNLSELTTLTYNANPPRLILSRTADFAGSADSGDGEERVAGDTAISIDLPFIYREGIDVDFSGSPIDGRNYPIGIEFGERYTQGLDGIPSDVAYARPNDPPQIGDAFTFPAGADFRHGNPTSGRSGSYLFDDYRDQGEIKYEHGANETNASIGAISEGDWFRYTFDLGDGDQVLIVNFEVNTWTRTGANPVDVYMDNTLVGSIEAPNTPGNEFNFFTVGPFEVSSGVHELVFAFPVGQGTPSDLGRIEITRIDGIGRVARTLTDEGSFDPGQSFDVTLNAEALFGEYTPYIEEKIPTGSDISNISAGGEQIGDKIIWTLDPTSASTQATYTISPPEGVRFLLFDGFADIGLPLADTVKGDSSVFNQVWLFGVSTADQTDNFDGSNLSGDWFVEFGSDPALDVNYEEGATIEVVDGVLSLGVDAFGEAGRFNEWQNGRRAPMVLRTDIPEGDWRIEADLSIVDAFEWTAFHVGIVVGYNDGNDENVTGDEYMFGFHTDELRIELANSGSLGSLEYHELSDLFDWFDLLDAGGINAKIAITRRGDELIFSAKLPDRPWQLLGVPAQEDRTATRIGMFGKLWGAESFATGHFDDFTLSALEAFTDVHDWALY